MPKISLGYGLSVRSDSQPIKASLTQIDTSNKCKLGSDQAPKVMAEITELEKILFQTSIKYGSNSYVRLQHFVDLARQVDGFQAIPVHPDTGNLDLSDAYIVNSVLLRRQLELRGLANVCITAVPNDTTVARLISGQPRPNLDALNDIKRKFAMVTPTEAFLAQGAIVDLIKNCFEVSSFMPDRHDGHLHENFGIITLQQLFMAVQSCAVASPDFTSQALSARAAYSESRGLPQEDGVL
jgi:hypothetical protein